MILIFSWVVGYKSVMRQYYKIQILGFSSDWSKLSMYGKPTWGYSIGDIKA